MSSATTKQSIEWNENMKTLISALFLVFALSGCIKKRATENALVRGAQVSAAEATCAKILPPQEYKSLVSQLTPADPLVVVSTALTRKRLN
jgi:hypothetical protein